MPIIILSQTLLAVSCLVIIGLLIFGDGKTYTRLLRWWRRGYYLSVKDKPYTTEEVNIASTWSLIHGGLIGLVLVILLSWIGE